MSEQKNQMAVRYKSLADGENSGYRFENSIDKIFSSGCYIVEVDHMSGSLGLPISYCGEEHYLVGTLFVTDSGTAGPLQKNRVAGQVLTFTSRKNKDTVIYIRTYADGKWSEWRSLVCTGMYDSITNTDELIASVTRLITETKDIEADLALEVTRATDAEHKLAVNFQEKIDAIEENAHKTIINYNDWKATDAEFSLPNVLADDDFVKLVISGTILTFKNTSSVWRRFQYVSANLSSEYVKNISNWRELSAVIYSVKLATDANKVQICTTGESGAVKDTLNIPAATTESAGIMSAADKVYLNNSSRGEDVPMLLRKNYYNPDDEDFLAGRILRVDGTMGENIAYCITGYIPLNSVIGQLICSRDGSVDSGNGGVIGFYDENKQPLFYKPYKSVNGIAVWEHKVAYVRFTVRLYNTSHIQIEKGYEYTSKIGYGESVWDIKLPDAYVEPQSLSPIFSVEKSLNLLNPSELQKGMAAYISDGEIKFTEISSQTASGFIEVKPLTTYTFSYSSNYFFLDTDKKVIGDKISAIGTAIATTPENCRYLVINFFNTRSSMGLYNLDTTARVYEGDIIYPYIPYGVSSDKMQTYLQQQSISSLGNDGVRITRETTAANTDFTTNTHNYPQSIKDNQISFYGEFDTFGTLTIGRGFTNNANAACRFEITTTNVTLSKYNGDWAQQATVEHGLSMNTYVKVLVSEKKNKVLLFVQTLTGSFEHEFDYWSANGTIAFNSSTEVSNAMLCASNPMFKCPVWMFGASFYGVDTPNRQRYWLRKWGYDNVLVQSFGGQGSSDAYLDLLRCLDFGTPKYIVWSMGMNDDNGEVLSDITTGVWYTTYQKVKKICEAMDIELILTTIPEVRGDYFNKDAISDVVRNSGLRYIDMAKAVGSNTAGEWYGNGTEYDYQSSDDVHPTELGAKAMAMQVLIDFPEIMQY